MVNTFYNGLSTKNRQLLDSHGPIPGMTPAEGLTAIQTMADHLQKWHDGLPSRSIFGSNNSEGMAAIASKLDNLGRDMKKLKENVHAIQVGCQVYGGPHLDKECPSQQRDSGASISIMPFFMYKRLGMGMLEPINMMIEMADNTKSIPKGIVKNLLIKIDKFIFHIDFVILDIIEDFKMPIILGRPLLATAHAKVNIFRKTISQKVGNEKVVFKMRSKFSITIFESVRAIKSEIHIRDDDYEPCDFNQLLDIDLDINAYDINM
nr:zinc knuckle CX2CX4HX4C [Tanacetum cinerariifolium]